jgi:hypothetical protein
MVVVLTRRQMPGARSQRWAVVRIALVIGRNHVHILNKSASRWWVLYVRTVMSSVMMMRSLFVESRGVVGHWIRSPEVVVRRIITMLRSP